MQDVWEQSGTAECLRCGAVGTRRRSSVSHVWIITWRKGPQDIISAANNQWTEIWKVPTVPSSCSRCFKYESCDYFW